MYITRDLGDRPLHCSSVQRRSRPSRGRSAGRWQPAAGGVEQRLKPLLVDGGGLPCGALLTAQTGQPVRDARAAQRQRWHRPTLRALTGAPKPRVQARAASQEATACSGPAWNPARVAEVQYKLR